VKIKTARSKNVISQFFLTRFMVPYVRVWADNFYYSKAIFIPVAKYFLRRIVEIVIKTIKSLGLEAFLWLRKPKISI